MTKELYNQLNTLLNVFIVVAIMTLGFQILCDKSEWEASWPMEPILHQFNHEMVLVDTAKIPEPEMRVLTKNMQEKPLWQR